MRLGELLDADIAVLGPRLLGSARDGVDWWAEELQGMVPAALRTAGGRGRRLVAERQGAGRYVLVERDGRARPHMLGRAPVKAVLRLAASVVLVRHLNAPPLPDRDLRRMMALDVDRLTPFRAEEVYIDVVLPPQPAGPLAKRPVLVGVVSRAVADLAVVEARAAGVEPSGLIAAAEGGAVLDFLPAMRSAGALGRGRRGAGLWWTAVAALVALNVGCWIWRDSRSLSDLQAAVAAQQPQVQRVAALRASLTAETQRRRALVAALAADEPLRALDAVSRALPDQAWVQRATFAPASIRLAGYHTPGVDVLAALKREPLLANVQRVSSEGAASDSGGGAGGGGAGDPFDVSADLAGYARVRRSAVNGLALRERRLIAIALLLALVAAVWLGVVRPVIGGFQDRADQRAAKRWTTTPATRG